MIRKIIGLCLFVLMVSCARPANKVQTMNASSGVLASGDVQLLWSGHGGTVGATNVVSGRLPMSGTISSGASETGFTIHTAPLVYKDTNGVQHVFALWANTSKLKLVKYEYSGGNLSTSNDFGTNGALSFTASNTGFKAHQIALAESTGGPVIFIAHAKGIDKYNAMSGEPIAQYSSTIPVFRLLVHNGMLYAQSSNQILKFNVSSLNTTLDSLPLDDYRPTRALPLVVSGDYIYFEHDNDVKRTFMITLNSLEKDTSNLNYDTTGLDIDTGTDGTQSERQKAAHNLTVEGSYIGAMAAYHKSVIYSVIVPKRVTKYTLTTVSTVDAIDTAFYVFGETPDQYFDDKIYKPYCDSIRSSNENDNNSSFCGHAVGSIEHTALSVHNKTLYLPGWSFSDFTTSNNKKKLMGPTLVSIGPNAGQDIQDIFVTKNIQIKGGAEQGDYVNSYYFFPTTRFVVHDTSGITLAIAHVSEWVLNSAPNLQNVLFNPDPYTTASRDNLNNYHSRILLGNQTSVTPALFDNTSMHVHSFSVGDGVVFMGGSDNTLYYLK